MAEWKRLASGKYVDLSNLTMNDIDIKDITISLNQIIRFGGHYNKTKPLTVAQHTMLCLSLADMFYPKNEEVRCATLIHDFGEAYYGDITTPVKRILGEGLRAFTYPIDKTINKVFYGLGDISTDVKDAVKFVDLLSMDIERKRLWDNTPYDDSYWPIVPQIIGWAEAQELYLTAAQGPVDFEDYL